MFFIIDGTGSEDDNEYFDEMKVGFCYNLYKKLNFIDSSALNRLSHSSQSSLSRS